MASETPRVRIDGIDWASAFPVVRLLGSFRMAIGPARMVPAVLLVVLMFLIGQGLDLVWGPRVSSGEFEKYLSLPASEFEQWRQERLSVPASVRDARGVFEAALIAELAAFRAFIASALELDFGLRSVVGQPPHQGAGVIAALWVMVLGVPSWLLSTYPAYTATLLLLGFLVLCAFGGVVARLVAVQACTGEPGRLGAAIQFVGRRYLWYFLGPVIPLLLAVVLAFALALCGLVFFNLPALDVAGALALGPMFAVGLVIALVFIGLLLGGNLLFAAISVEGSDAFDAVSRVYNYALGRPLRFLVYTVVVIVYGALTYVLVGIVVFLTLWITQRCLSTWVFTEVDGVSRLEAIFPEPSIGELYRPADWGALRDSSWGMAAAGIATAWVQLLLAVLPAYALSYYLSAQTWVYLLLRRVSDGTEFEEHDQQPPRGGAAPDKVEPA